ncbi:hypothetical protein [Nonomuraea phyllanthi]|uniref:hypothetical protein n=1 Tax=Nonomuraea phyllanthi TaxID=2219224 RepID=UPI00186AC0DF|nr:hypothetical protein [Nonomuraea phyllanthi]
MTQQKISVWGAPGSGKTTFLAALNIAMIRSNLDWTVVAKNQDSADRLAAMTNDLTRERFFPKPTTDVNALDYVLLGPRRTRRKGWFFRRTTVTEQTRVELSLVDVPGSVFASTPFPGATDELPDPLDDLIASNGVLFLFDPIRESALGDSFDYFHGVLSRLAQRSIASGVSSAWLPHRLAVCITKFDDVRVLEVAERRGLITTDPDDPYRMPKVDSADAEELFAALCETSASGNSEMLLSGIRRFFRPEHVRFFATSTIGFHVDPVRNAYDPDDFQNVVPVEEGHRIRGPVRPINVLEPILWLADQLTADSPGRVKRSATDPRPSGGRPAL